MSELDVDPQGLELFDDETLTSVVRRVLKRPTAEINVWSCERLLGGQSASQHNGTMDVVRVAGSAVDRGETLPWSVVLKTFDGSRGNPDPSHCDYWKREPLWYQSGLPEVLAGGLRAAECYGVFESDDNKAQVWLEEIEDAKPGEWPTSHYYLAGRHLGQFNGSFLVSGEVPDLPWLSRGRVEDWLALAEPVVAELPRHLDHPHVKLWLGPNGAERTMRLWHERRRFMDILEKLPQTMCHHDAFRRNLMSRNNGSGELETVAIDWSYAGRGPLGAELATMAVTDVVMGEADISRLPEIDDAIFEGYVAGLQESGLNVDRRTVRLGYTLSTALLWGLSVLWMAIPDLANGRVPEAHIRDTLAVIQSHQLDHADEGRQLANEIP